MWKKLFASQHRDGSHRGIGHLKIGHPGIERSIAVRKMCAVVLVCAAVLVTVIDYRSKNTTVVIYTTDITAGTTIDSRDVRRTRLPAAALPTNYLDSVDDAVGHITTTDRPAGGIATASDFVDSALMTRSVTNTTEISSPVPRNMVPITLADPTIAGLLQPGDTVSIITATDDDATPRVIAAGGRIIFAVTSDSTIPGATPGTILVSLDEDSAHTVAAASLSTPLGVVVTGDRAQ